MATYKKILKALQETGEVAKEQLILKELKETTELAKARVYVKNPADAPKGARLQRGKRGGAYYEEGGAKPTVKPITSPEFGNKIHQAAAGKAELSNAEYQAARKVYDQLAQVEDISKHPPEHQKLWDSLVQLMD